MNKWMALIGILLANVVHSQIAPRLYGIEFKDKHDSPYNLSRSEEFLSPRCLERRLRHGVAIDSLDLPVNPAYLEAVLQYGSAVVKHTSRWFNSAVLFVVDTTVIDSIEQLPMVRQVRRLPSREPYTNPMDKFSPILNRESEGIWNSTEEVEQWYGPSYHQTAMMNGPLLHGMGYTGQGMHIAVLDAGWARADMLEVFESVRREERLLGTRDFVFDLNDPVFHSSNHGTYVWSIMAGMTPGQLVGTAYDASYYLLRTENPGSEHIAEEWNWVAGAEFADSAGVDIINSSLGYSLFDWESENHSYQDMDGNTTISSRGADIAAAKGILVVNSAGNSADNPWRHITAPSDADSVLCIGATWPDSTVAWFSSRGPSSDGDVKPNVSAQGVGVVFAAIDSTFATGNGTSFSAPLVAGLAACLWQAFPAKSNMEILRAIEQSAHLHVTPNDDVGYGVPDFWKAYQFLAGLHMDDSPIQASLWPNPSQGQCTIQFQHGDAAHVSYEVYDAVGRRLYERSGTYASAGQGLLRLDSRTMGWSPGVYYVHLEVGDRHSVLPWVIDP